MGLKPDQLRPQIDDDGPKSPFGLMQIALLFCAQPETLPVFIQWCKSETGQEPPLTDEQIQRQLVLLSDWIYDHMTLLMAVRTAEKAIAAKKWNQE